MTAAIAAKPRSYRWPTIIVALLAGHVVLMMWAVFKATADPNFVVIPNYYDKAVNWDKEQARRAASEKLGWRAEVVVDAKADALNRRNVTVNLVDATGAAVSVESIQLDGYHDADPSHPFTLKLTRSAPGVFTTQLPAIHGGFCQFNIEAKLGSLEFVQSWRQYVAPVNTK